jgi:ribosomal protein L11 methyltransferase
MIRSELWPLRDDIENLLADNGYFVVSGQLEEEKQYVLDWFNECGFTLDAELIRGEWWSARARRS